LGLPLADKLARLVDEVGLGSNVGVTLRRKRPDSIDLLISGTPDQLDVFKRAINLHQEFVRRGFTGLALDAEMNNFVALQKIRYRKSS